MSSIEGAATRIRLRNGTVTVLAEFGPFPVPGCTVRRRSSPNEEDIVTRRMIEHEASVRQIAAGDERAVRSFASLEWRLNAERPLSVASTEADVVKLLTGRSVLHADLEHALFVATNADGREVACCAAMINRRYQQFHKEAVGFTDTSRPRTGPASARSRCSKRPSAGSPNAA